jgi:hypothetical protein
LPVPFLAVTLPLRGLLEEAPYFKNPLHDKWPFKGITGISANILFRSLSCGVIKPGVTEIFYMLHSGKSVQYGILAPCRYRVMVSISGCFGQLWKKRIILTIKVLLGALS